MPWLDWAFAQEKRSIAQAGRLIKRHGPAGEPAQAREIRLPEGRPCPDPSKEAIPWHPKYSYPTSCRKPPSRSSAIAASTSTFMPDVGKDKEKLLEIIGEYDGLAIRSATKVDREAHRRRRPTSR
jgi:hypothetical protein